MDKVRFLLVAIGGHLAKDPVNLHVVMAILPTTVQIYVNVPETSLIVSEFMGDSVELCPTEFPSSVRDDMAVYDFELTISNGTYLDWGKLPVRLQGPNNVALDRAVVACFLVRSRKVFGKAPWRGHKVRKSNFNQRDIHSPQPFPGCVESKLCMEVVGLIPQLASSSSLCSS